MFITNIQECLLNLSLKIAQCFTSTASTTYQISIEYLILLSIRFIHIIILLGIHFLNNYCGGITDMISNLKKSSIFGSFLKIIVVVFCASLCLSLHTLMWIASLPYLWSYPSLRQFFLPLLKWFFYSPNLIMNFSKLMSYSGSPSSMIKSEFIFTAYKVLYDLAP